MEEREIGHQSKINWIIWGSMLAGIFGIVAVGFVVAHGEVPTEEQLESARTLFPIMVSTTIADIVALFYMREVLFLKGYKEGLFETKSSLAKQYRVASIVQWSLGQAVAIYGLVLTILTMETLYVLGFAAPALLLHLYLRPQLRQKVEGYKVPDPNDEWRGNQQGSAGGW